MSDHRLDLLGVLQGNVSPLDGASAVVGYLLVVELITPVGERGVVRISCDAAGRALPWHSAQGLAAAAAQLEDYDDPTDDEPTR